MTALPALKERLEFMGLDEGAKQNLLGIKDVIERELPAALDLFYRRAMANPQMREFFSNESVVAGAKSRQISHWSSIASGDFSERFFLAVSKVGETHARIGLEPRWYIGGYAVIFEALLSKVLEARWPKGGFGVRGPTAKQVAAELGALAKATLLDMDLAISVYLDTLNARREKADNERKLTEARQSQVTEVLGEKLQRLAQGDLTARIDVPFEGNYEKIKVDYNAAIESLVEAMSSIGDAVDSFRGTSREIAIASENLSSRTEQQAASLEETAAALNQITTTVIQNANGAKKAAATATSARNDATRSAEVMRDANAAMAEIKQSFEKISGTLSMIDEIAFQTNLLALNAGVEAARAGESGRGFAVVAQEVRVLAQRSAEAAKVIKTLLTNSSSHVDRGVRSVGETGESLSGIVARVAEIDQLVAEIAASSEDQASSLNEINQAVTQMDQVTQQNAAMVEEATAAAASLNSDSNELAVRVARFQTGRARRASAPEVASPSKHAPGKNPVGRSHAKIANAFRGRSEGDARENWTEF